MEQEFAENRQAGQECKAQAVMQGTDSHVELALLNKWCYKEGDGKGDIAHWIAQ